MRKLYAHDVPDAVGTVGCTDDSGGRMHSSLERMLARGALLGPQIGAPYINHASVFENQ
jgi:hypothetical protein